MPVGLAFCDPYQFIADGLHDHLDQWHSLLDIVNNEQSVEVHTSKKRGHYYQVLLQEITGN